MNDDLLARKIDLSFILINFISIATIFMRSNLRIEKFFNLKNHLLFCEESTEIGSK